MDYEYDSDRRSQREELFSALRLEDFLSSSGTPRYFLPGTLSTASAFVVMRYLSTVILKLVPIDSMKRKIKNSYCREHLSVPRYEILVRARSDLRHPAVRSVIVDTTKGSLEKSFLFALCHLDGHSSAVSRPSDLGIRIRLIMASVNEEKAMDGAVSVVAETMKKTTLLSAMTWDVFSPPPSNSFKGKVIPRIVSKYQNPRKVSIEIHRITPLIKREDGSTIRPYEECVLRVLRPIDKAATTKARREGISKILHHEGTYTSFTSIRDLVSENDDDVSLASTANIHSKSGGLLRDTGGKHFEGWIPKYRIPCGSITIEHRQNRSVHLLFQVGPLKQEREVIFDTVEDANKFCAKLENERDIERTRAQARLQYALGDLTLAPFEKISLLIEVVSGWELPVGDRKTSDPYVVCMLGRREVHRTKHISGTLSPIWTVKTGSLFLLELASDELFIEGGIEFIVKDFDQFGVNEILGLVHIPPRALYLGNGERMDFKLQPLPGTMEKEVPGYLCIRCRRASDYDKNFMAKYSTATKEAIVAQKLPKSRTNAIRSILDTKFKSEDGAKIYKVRPKPDPKRPNETEWMTKQDLIAESMKPSRFWTDTGNGNLGRIYLEILSANDLPNLDSGSWLGNLTDAFVSIVYQDTFVRTDVIDDCLNPIWLPWSHRAFILNIAHPSSQIFLGIFDFDAGFDDHDLIGRVSVDITNLRPDTEYVLNYNIYPSARVGDRKTRGNIKIRLRLEIPDERMMALASLEPPLPTYVNVKKGKEFRVIRQTCLGSTDVDKYSTTTLSSYITELIAYQNALLYIEDALTSLLLWRGHFELSISGKKVLLPLHSFNAFVAAILLVENPQLFPSFCFAGIAWFLIAVMGWRRSSPDEWSRCQSYGEILQKVVLGSSSTPPHSIKAFQNHKQATAALEKWLKRIEETEAAAQRAYTRAQDEEAERLKEQEEIGEADADISTKVGGGLSLDPIKLVLHPMQLILGVACRSLRFIKHVIYWEEAYYSFWIATTCAFLAIACLFIPWFFIIQWTARLTVWTFFGPWMKLVDIFYVSTLEPETEAQRIEREHREREERRMMTSKAAREARQVRENAAKMREIKKFMFGKFAMRIPILKQDRYYDRPLPNSTATPYKDKALTLAELAMQEAGYNRIRLPGQNLVGDMIPIAESEGFTRAPTGEPTANPEKLAKDTLGGGQNPKADSTTAAYAQITSLVIAAGILTFFGVPVLASFTEFLLGMLEKLDTAQLEAMIDENSILSRTRALLAETVTSVSN